MNIERANIFANVLRNSEQIPVDVGDTIEMNLPEYADSERIKNAQRMFRCNIHAMMFSMYLGLVAILAIPSILNVLIHTNKSSSDLTAYKRYMQTIFHTLTWFRNELSPGSKAWKSLAAIRKFHFSASRSSNAANIGIISQKDMAITQYGFMGFAVISRKEVGVQCSQKELEDFCHFWRVLGHVIGINNEYNLCAETFEETLERLNVVRAEFLLPNLQIPQKDFEPMTRYIVNGLFCFDHLDSYNEIIFMVKRLCGVPDFYYLSKEIPENYDRKKLALYKFSYWDRFVIWMSVMTRQFLLQCCIFRWIFNIGTLMGELFIRYLPFIAFFKFGIRNSYVNIKL